MRRKIKKIGTLVLSMALILQGVVPVLADEENPYASDCYTIEGDEPIEIKKDFDAEDAVTIDGGSFVYDSPASEGASDYVYAENAQVIVNGDISSENNLGEAEGVCVYNAAVAVDGDITAKAADTARGVLIMDTGYVSVSGDVKAAASENPIDDHTSYGIHYVTTADTPEGIVGAEVDGNVTVDSTNRACGLFVNHGSENNCPEFEFRNNVTVNSDNLAYGVFSNNKKGVNSPEIDLHRDLNVNADNLAYGVYNIDSLVTVYGDIYVKSDSQATGITNEARRDDVENETYVLGDVIVEGPERAGAIDFYGGSVWIEGNASSNRVGAGVSVNESTSGNTDTLVVMGTLSGDIAALRIVAEDEDYSNILEHLPGIYVGKLETKEDGKLIDVLSKDLLPVDESVENLVASAINYIVYAPQNDIVFLRAGEELDAGEKYLFREGRTFVVAPSKVSEGYTVDGIYAGEYATVTPNGDGTYTILVNRGGDLNLVLRTSKIVIPDSSDKKSKDSDDSSDVSVNAIITDPVAAISNAQASLTNPTYTTQTGTVISQEVVNEYAASVKSASGNITAVNTLTSLAINNYVKASMGDNYEILSSFSIDAKPGKTTITSDKFISGQDYTVLVQLADGSVKMIKPSKLVNGKLVFDLPEGNVLSVSVVKAK